ncbi:hypothetical protein MHYP_G00280200 [Metynnis hypsauchen]
MEPKVPIWLCNISAISTHLTKGTCLGILIETLRLPKVCSKDSCKPQKQDQDNLENTQRQDQGSHSDMEAPLQRLHRDRDLGHFSTVTHRIDTGNAQPVRQATRHTPLGFQAEEAEHLQEMLSSGVVVPSTSKWASPVVLVWKKDGGVRWCIDYRKLNDLTLKDAYPLPNIEECLDTLKGATVFSTLDLQSGYWQVEVRKQDRCKTAFITKYGLFEYTLMHFRLCNAPSTFQRAMEVVLWGLQWHNLLIYLDYVIVLGKDIDDSLKNLEVVFEHISQYGLKLKPTKCHLLKEEVLFLGHIISGEGIRPKSLAYPAHYRLGSPKNPF